MNEQVQRKGWQARKVLQTGLVGLVLLSHSLALRAAQITLAWDANPEPGIAGYKLYYGTPGTYPGAGINCGNVTNFTVSGLQPGGAYSFHVTCYNTSGLESDPSNVVHYTVPISGDGAPEVSALRVTAGGLEMRWTATAGTTYRILFKNELTETAWQFMDEFQVDDTSGYFVDAAFRSAPRRFYKLEVVP